MTQPIHNLRSNVVAVLILIVGPLGLALVGTAGVVSKPALDLENARGLLERSIAHAAHSAAQRDTALLYRSGDVAERARQISRELAADFPRAVDPVEVYGAMRIAADATGVILHHVNTSTPVDAGFAVLDDWIAYREVTLRGEAEPDELLRMVDSFQVAGLPVAVLDFSLQRNDPSTERFEFGLSLALFQSLPLEEMPQTDEELDEEQEAP